MHFISQNEYQKEWEQWPQNMKKAIIIDLTDKQDDVAIIRELASYLRGSRSISMADFGNNLDALNDVLGDFFCDTWFEKQSIYILGFSHLYKKNAILAFKIIDILSNESMYAGIALMRGDVDEQEREGIHDNVQNKWIYFVLDDEDFRPDDLEEVLSS